MLELSGQALKHMGNCRSKPGGGGGGGGCVGGVCGGGGLPVERVGKDYDYMASAGTSGFGLNYNRNGFGGGYSSGYGGYGYGSSCPEGVNQNTALLATAAAIAVGAGVIYRAVTLQQGRRRRRREVGGSDEVQTMVLDIIALGEKWEV